MKQRSSNFYINNVNNANINNYDILQYPTGYKDYVIFKKGDQEYKQRYDHFIHGMTQKKLSGDKISESMRLDINSINKLLNGTNYEIMNLNEYKNCNSNLKFHNIKCGHTFYRSLNNFRKNKECPICHKNNTHIVRAKTTKQFKKDVLDIFGDEYLVLGEYVNSRTKIKIQHKNCGTVFYPPAGRFLREHGYKCPKCSGRSIGEYYIEKYLLDNNIDYIHEYTTSDLKMDKNLQIDFYIKKFNLFIEYDGEHHFSKTEFLDNNTSFNKVKMSDKLKKEYAKNNNINLLRIPYWEYQNIKIILNEYFKNPLPINTFYKKMKQRNIHLNKSYYKIYKTKKIA